MWLHENAIRRYYPPTYFTTRHLTHLACSILQHATCCSAAIFNRAPSTIALSFLKTGTFDSWRPEVPMCNPLESIGPKASCASRRRPVRISGFQPAVQAWVCTKYRMSRSSSSYNTTPNKGGPSDGGLMTFLRSIDSKLGPPFHPLHYITGISKSESPPSQTPLLRPYLCDHIYA